MQPTPEAHRGYSARFPENTLLAFQQAIAVGAKSMELDIHPSADGEFMVIHDARLERTTNGKGEVAKHSAAELAKLDAGSWKNPAFAGERIPALEQVLALSQQNNVYCNIEIKSFTAELFDVKRLVALLHKYAPKDAKHMLSSFDVQALLQVKQYDSNIPLAIIGGDGYGMLAQALEHQIPWIHCHYSRVNHDLLLAAHAKGIRINAWTVNQPSLYRHYARMGLDKICTDYIAEMIPA
ncbi:MAG: hypothetical protein GX946_03455 [Oligosphaeraceae bacterium]|nr:hypothetical protein [Oligosphaeraceae bacterium]